mgnify:CR=1 FL=1
MELKVFSIFDKATEAFNLPFFMLTEKEAIRAFTNMALDETTQINKHKHDYHLYYLGRFDNKLAAFHDMNLRDMGSAATYVVNETNVNELFPAEEQA